MSKADQLEQEVRALESLDLDSLRAEWLGRWGEAPKLRSVELLRHMMAWRIQAAALGGLDAPMLRRLRKAPATAPGPQLRPGMRVVREWKGVRYEVEVVRDGFMHRGAAYSNLSQIARAITGVRWNGPRFFGLRPGEAK